MKINTNFETFKLSDIGKKRTNNEDYIQIEKNLGLVVLADGMGGYNAGEVASKLAATTLVNTIKGTIDEIANPLQHLFQPHEMLALLNMAVYEANKAVHDQANTNVDHHRMGTTLLFAMFFTVSLMVGHIGDSKLFRFRNNALTPLTVDHSIVQEQIYGGVITPDQAKSVNYKNFVTRSIGSRADVTPEIQVFELIKEDIFLLCSDGLTDLISDEVINETLIKYAKSLDKAAQKLIDLANEAGGTDNISVILVKHNQDA